MASDRTPVGVGPTHGRMLSTLYMAIVAFSLYTCVYGFRKTFPAATFDNMSYFGISYKAWLVMAQAVGYGLSKFIGIKVISELKRQNRRNGILLLSGVAGLSWLLFAIVPAPYNILFLIMNGLPLGMIWGIIFAYLEGRTVTEILGAALSTSFIFSSGLCRSVGAWLIEVGQIPEHWMPLAAAGIFSLPLVLFAFLLDRVPPPDKRDELMRTRRGSMTRAERGAFVKRFFAGIVLFIVAYVMLTAYRDFRDFFSAEVWQALQHKPSPDVYTRTEIPVALSVLIVVSLVSLINNNQSALLVNHLIIAGGMAMIGFATALFQKQLIDPTTWMIGIGCGLYLGYVPFNSIFFERMLAAFRISGTAGFIMYVSDSFGYLGSLAILFIKEFMFGNISWLKIFIVSGYAISFSGFILIMASMIYFQQKSRVSDALPAEHQTQPA